MSVVETGVAKFHYHRAGSGSPVLLLPGAGGWQLTFQAMVARLSEHHTVYALDPPGQGETEIISSGFPYGTDGIVGAIGSFLDAMNLDRPAVVGHSWGGGFAVRLAELHPERVSRLVLLAPAGLDVKDVWEFRLLRLPLVGELGARLMARGAIRHMLRKSFVHPERIPSHLVSSAVRALDRPEQRAAMLKVERSVRWPETERDLPRVHVPVLLIWGQQDRYLPVGNIGRFTSQLPLVEAHILRDAGHSVHDDSPEETYAVLTPFLAAP